MLPKVLKPFLRAHSISAIECCNQLLENRMSSIEQINAPGYRRELGDGLIVRWSTPADIAQVAELYGNVFRESLEQEPSPRMGYWAADVMSGRHPGAGPNDLAIVEDTRSKSVVSALMVLRQTWSYAGIPFEIGRPEAVATHPEYRNRGTVRAIFELLHARSAARGQMVQGITGISYFYRQFGYEYAFELEGSRRILFTSLPKLKEGEAEPYTLRQATIQDLTIFEQLYERERTGAFGKPPLVSTTFDQNYWRWVFEGQNPESGQGARVFFIQNQAGQELGYVLTVRFRWGDAIPIFGLSVAEGAPLLEMMPSVLRGMEQVARASASWRESTTEPNRLALILGEDHPAYGALNKNLISRSFPAYGWYVRVPDLPAFMRHIAPALEQRLAQSALGGYSGELKLDFYRSAMRLVFEKGKLTVAEPWQRPIWKPETSAGFPPLVFLQLLFGRRSLDELMYAFPDVWADDDPALVLNTLFPKQRSWALGQD
jgi:GNAT superfamily N-acetyltransferase